MSVASHIIWQGAGCPEPCDSTGATIRKRGTGTCAACGSAAEYLLSDTISDSFSQVKNAGRAWGFGGNATCAACVFAARTLRLRCSAWWATMDGVSFWRTRPIVQSPQAVRALATEWWKAEFPDTRPDGVAVLCNPPEPPFVAAIPLTGIAHGGESHLMRTWWPTWQRPAGGYLERLQSKHVAIYARVATERYRFPLQVDDIHDVVVDVALWTTLHSEAMSLIEDMKACGVFSSHQEAALRSVTVPRLGSLALTRSWASKTRLMRQYARAQWWPLFVSLLPIQRSNDE